ncbi:MAG: RNA methyltransferase [Muribaculaceae bacterium]|nr:RNA methyltransferase [Muribaculaceae bacterium]MDE6753361.1 RNA methyltransferase [Muribaculaceae bacterium]
MELSKSKLSVLMSLASKKMRNKHKLFLAEGEKCVRDMCEVFELDCVLVSENWFRDNEEKCVQFHDKLYRVDERTLKKVSSLTTPSSLIAAFKLPDNKEPRINSGKLYLLADGIQDPGNMGTIIRTADWFGINEILASDSTVDVYNPKTVQAAMGSLRHVNVYYCSLEKIIENHSEMKVYGTVLDGKNIYKEKLTQSGFIVMGNEGKGITPSVRRLINCPLYIPPYSESTHGESLNVAIATAITLSRFRFG